MRSNKKTIRALKSRFLFALCIIGFSIAGCSCTANSSEKAQDLSLFIRLDCLDDIEYHAINADEREKYGIAPDNEGSAITKDDFGEYIGVISEVRNGSGKGVLGRKAYHYRSGAGKLRELARVDESAVPY